jgi:hypothetical protein
MDLKLKIILVIFVALAFMYLGHFIINYMSNKTKQESVTEEFNDVEHYDEPSNQETTAKSSNLKYDQRILILDDIEKLAITNKEVKGKLMEKLFEDSVIKTISEMSSSERALFIKKQLDELMVQPKTEAETKTEKIEPKKTENLDFDPSSLVTKTQETIKSLQSVQDGLKEIHRIAESFKSPSPSVQTQKEISSFKEPYIPPISLLEGFENMRSYAPLF